MLMNDALTLIALTPPADATNARGFENAAGEVATEVYARKKDVGYSEFYKAQAAGYETLMKFDVYTEEYAGQTLAEVDGIRYKVLRTYQPKEDAGMLTELTLTDLSEGG